MSSVVFFFISSVIIFSGLVYLQREGFSTKNFLIVSPMFLTANYLWLLGFQVESSIAKNWLVSTVIINSTVLAGSFLFLKEELTVNKIIAILFLAIGFIFIYLDKKSIEVIAR